MSHSSSAASGSGPAGNKKRSRHPQADVYDKRPFPHGGSSSFSPSPSPSGASSSLSTAFGSDGPRTLHVLEFAEARAREIANLTHLMMNSGGASANAGTTTFAPTSSTHNPAQISGGGRRVFQSLPRHMRRRAMSHNVKRLPNRLQAAARREMDKIAKGGEKNEGEGGAAAAATKTLSRRARRRPRNILAAHALRLLRHQWLETHLWHAKRMKMHNAWGYRLATNPTDRSLRACFNANVHLATIFDASFFQVLSLHGETQAILSIMRRVTTKSQWEAMQNPQLLSGNREGTLHLFHHGTAPYGFVAQVKYQWAGAASISGSPQQSQLWLWLHPSIYALVQTILESIVSHPNSSSSSSSSIVKLVPLVGQLCRLELRGHRCQAVMRMAIRAVETATAAASDDSSSVPSSPSIASLLTKYNSPALFPAHAVYPFLAQHPQKMQPPPTQPFEFQSENEARQKGRGPISAKKNNSFSKATDQTMSGTLSASHHEFLFTQAKGNSAVVSPLFDADFRARHSKETEWGKKKQRYKKIAIRDLNRKRKMHEARGEVVEGVLGQEMSQRLQQLQAEEAEEVAAMSDTTSIRHKKGSTQPATGKNTPKSKDDMDVGSSSTPLPTSTDTAAPLTSQPYLLLIQQPGSSLQASATEPKLHVNSASHSLGSGWDIICSSGWGVLLWKALIYSGARALGSDDRARFLHEQAKFDDNSPADFPDSHAGLIDALCQQQKQSWKEARIPTNKKPAFERLHVSHPFADPYAELLGLGEHNAFNAKYLPSVTPPTPTQVTLKQNQPTVPAKASESEYESGNESSSSSCQKNKKQKVEDASYSDAKMADVGEAVVNNKSSKSTNPSSSKKKRPPPPSEAPFELLATPTAFAHSVVPYFVWREWKTQYSRAKQTNAQLSLLDFLSEAPAVASFAAFVSSSSVVPPLTHALLPFALSCESGGMPEDHAFISQPLEDEWKRFQTQTPDDSVFENRKPQPWDVLMERNNKKSLPANPLRETIGHCLRGWFSYQRGCGVALGFVRAEAFVKLLKAQTYSIDVRMPIDASDPKSKQHFPSIWVWTRNQNSLTYRAAQLQII